MMVSYYSQPYIPGIEVNRSHVKKGIREKHTQREREREKGKRQDSKIVPTRREGTKKTKTRVGNNHGHGHVKMKLIDDFIFTIYYTAFLKWNYY